MELIENCIKFEKHSEIVIEIVTIPQPLNAALPALKIQQLRV